MVPAFRMGVQSRLFKGSVLCQITPWQYNPNSVSRLENSTTGDCGSGWYNSHGFVQVSDGIDWQNYVTFPTNPIEYISTDDEVQIDGESVAMALEPSINDNGQTIGSAEDVDAPEDIPDLVVEYGTEGQIGYVSSDLLMSLEESTSIPLYASDGTTVLGEFSIGVGDDQ